jgi:hypothetical protein
VTYDEILARVYPYVGGCPPQTALQHTIDAARTFFRRSLAWNAQHAAITTVAGQAGYTLTLPDNTQLVRVLFVEVDDGAQYTVQNGSLGRKFVREATGRNVCVVALPGTLTLDPPPPVSDQDLIVDYALMPDGTGLTVFPDDLEEHAEYIAAGAIRTLCTMPGVTWREPETASDHGIKFQRRIDATYHQFAKTVVRSERAKTQWF